MQDYIIIGLIVIVILSALFSKSIVDLIANMVGLTIFAIEALATYGGLLYLYNSGFFN